MKGNLYFVSTPIGNLKDITLRALDTLRSVDVIACEDTRHSAILMNAYDIKKMLIAYHKNNERNSAEGIIMLLSSGKSVAVVSDAGMPVISDPGNILVNRAREEGISYTILPGANAGLSALVLSGFDASVFSFFGFLPEQPRDRKEMLKSISNCHHTLIMYSSRYNVNKDMEYLYQALGGRDICIANEITKMYEKTIFGILGEIEVEEPKGEYVLVIAPKVAEQIAETKEELLQKLLASGMDKKTAIKETAHRLNLPKNEVYKLGINNIN